MSNKAEKIEEEAVAEEASEAAAEQEQVDYTNLSLEDKYRLIVQNVNAQGGTFFMQVSPDQVALPPNDPLFLNWVAIRASFSAILVNLENFIAEHNAKEEADGSADADQSDD